MELTVEVEPDDVLDELDLDDLIRELEYRGYTVLEQGIYLPTPEENDAMYQWIRSMGNVPDYVREYVYKVNNRVI